MAWPTGTYIDNLSIDDPPQYFLGAVWDCVSSGSSSSNLKITFPWGETQTVNVPERQTTTWYNPDNPNEWLSFWPAGCSSSGTYGIANYDIIDLCEGITCPDFCDYENHIKYLNGRCIDGECVYDIIENSVECGYIPPDPCEGITCKNICIGTDLYSQKCIDGECVTDVLLKINSFSCGYIPPDPCEDVVCNNICIGTDLYSQKCIDGLCIIDALIKENSVDYCGYIPPIEPPIDDEIEPPSDLTKVILPIGVGIGLLLLSKK